MVPKRADDHVRASALQFVFVVFVQLVVARLVLLVANGLQSVHHQLLGVKNDH